MYVCVLGGFRFTLWLVMHGRNTHGHTRTPTPGHTGTGEALENGDVARVARNDEFLQLLRAQSADKIDFATAHLLSHWDAFTDGDEVRYVRQRNTPKSILTFFPPPSCLIYWHSVVVCPVSYRAVPVIQ